jgi:hypothetical protein
MKPAGRLAERLVELSERLQGFEVVPGVTLPAPTFEALGSGALADVEEAPLPSTFLEFLAKLGAISAMDTAGGVAFLMPEQVRDHLRQDYGHLLRSVDGVPTLPFAVTGSGGYLLLALDDSAVWKFNAHLHPVAKPIRIAGGFDSFLEGLIADWEAVLAGSGGPYTTS